MKRRITALLTALLLALTLCVPALAVTEYGAYYDETDQLGSVELTYQGEKMLPQLTQELGVDLRVDAFTEEDVSSLIFWSRPAASRSWFHTTWKQEPHRQPRAAATTNRAADSISLALTPSRFQDSHFCCSS